MQKSVKIAPINLRLFAFLIDHCLILACSMSVLLGILNLAKVISGSSHENFIFWVGGLIIISLYFIKDLKDGVSPGKKLLGIRISHIRNTRPHPLQLFFRHITLPIWPIEIILMGLNKNHQKCADLIFQTKVVLIAQNVGRKKFLLHIFIIMLLCTFFGASSSFYKF
jgi:uncharacterized RDD family membrane protein YckC